MPTYSYGVTSDRALSEIEVELAAYKMGAAPEHGHGGLGRTGHFKRIVEMLFGPKSEFPFVWNPWSEKMIDAFHRHPTNGMDRPHIGVSGCASSSKSHTAGLYGLINWLCSPNDTFVFVTSTSISDSKQRVWKSISKLFQSRKGLPGNLVDSQAKIVTLKPDGKTDDSAGIFIIAGAPSKAREGVGKMIGRKNARVFLIADELPELSPAILDAGFGNLSSNPFFQFIALGNFKSRYDPFGEFIEPAEGWDSITVDSEEWECKSHGAYCIRFDGLKSPNLKAGKDIFPQIYGHDNLKKHKASYGENSAPFMRMCRSFETGVGDDDTIYSESDFGMGRAYEKAIWKQGFVRVAGCDPSFTNGGDRFVVMFGKIGVTIQDVLTLEVDHFELLREDVRIIQQRNRSFQMADQIKARCEAFGVLPQNFGMDTTATGNPFGDVVSQVWSNRIYRVDFSASTTERAATQDGKLAYQVFDRRVTEIWYIGKELLKGHQLKGLLPDIVREAKARKYETVKGAEGLKMKAETKKDMKERLMFSPDIFEAFAVMIDLCRERHKLVPAGFKGSTASNSTSFKELAKQMNRVYTAPAYA